jgi:hypothetical protein
MIAKQLEFSVEQSQPVTLRRLAALGFELIVIQEVLEFVLQCKGGGCCQCQRWELICVPAPIAEPFLLLRQAALPVEIVFLVYLLWYRKALLSIPDFTLQIAYILVATKTDRRA